MDKSKKSATGSRKSSSGRGSGSRRGGSSGPTQPVQSPLGYTPQPPPQMFWSQTSPPQFYSQPNYQPPFFHPPNAPTMVAPGRYEYSTEAQNSFDPFALRSPPLSSPRENVERQLPIYIDSHYDDDVVPETQEEVNVQDNDEEDEENENEDEDAADRRGGKAERQTWTKSQEEALAMAWVHTTLNKKKCNQQRRDSFWKQVLNHYNNTVGGSTRTQDQVRSKWQPMQTKLNLFNGLYHQASRLRGSGEDDRVVMRRALADYQRQHPGGFQHVEAWEIVNKHDKWAQCSTGYVATYPPNKQ